MPVYDIWKVQEGYSVVDGPYYDEAIAKERAKELRVQTHFEHVAVEQGSELESELLRDNPATR